MSFTCKSSKQTYERVMSSPHPASPKPRSWLLNFAPYLLSCYARRCVSSLVYETRIITASVVICAWAVASGVARYFLSVQRLLKNTGDLVVGIVVLSAEAVRYPTLDMSHIVYFMIRPAELACIPDRSSLSLFSECNPKWKNVLREKKCRCRVRGK